MPLDADAFSVPLAVEVGMPTAAPYDEIADWYESVFLAAQRAQPSPDGFADRLGIDRCLTGLLGSGSGVCLEVGCGTGVYAGPGP